MPSVQIYEMGLYFQRGRGEKEVKEVGARERERRGGRASRRKREGRARGGDC